MEQAKVSVIIPIYKVEKYLVQCLESVVNQTLRELEIILLDEGEQDRCREIIDFYEAADSRIVTIHEPNRDASYGAKVNRGLDRATGKYIGIVEPDDFIEPDMYETLYRCAEETGANLVKAAYFDYFSAKKHSVSKDRGFLNQYLPQGKVFTLRQFPQLLAAHPSIWSGLYRTQTVRARGLRMLEAPGAGYVDNRFYLDAYRKLERIVWIDKAVYHWRRTGENSSSTKRNWNHRVMLERWNENLDRISSEGEEEYSRYAPFFASKAWLTIMRHYLDGWTFQEEEYRALAAFLNRFTEEEIQAAPRLKAEQREQMLLCRNDPERFKREHWTSPGPEGPETKEQQAPEKQEKSEKPVPKEQKTPEKAAEEKDSEKQKAPKREPQPEPAETKAKSSGKKKKKSSGLRTCLLAAFWGAVYCNLTGLALRAGVYRGLLAEEVSEGLTAGCGVLAVVCLAVLCGCALAALCRKAAVRGKNG